MTPSNTDVLIIGAGFSGLSALHTLRTSLPSLSCHILEAASDLGGVWHWNRYPGARVDSEWPFYQLTIPAAFRGFTFSERFPDHVEIRRYFAHLESVLGFKRDVTFNARVCGADWVEGDGQSETTGSGEGRWVVRTENGIQVQAKYLILCSGLLHKPYVPAFEGLGDLYHHNPNPDYTATATTTTTSSLPLNLDLNLNLDSTEPDHTKPLIIHSSTYPTTLDTAGKRIAVIGAGATGVQIVQDLSKTASHLTLYMRRPSPCLPMRNRPLTKAENESWRPFLPVLFDASRRSRTGLPYANPPMAGELRHPQDPGDGEKDEKKQDYSPNPITSTGFESIFSLTPAQRDAFYESLWTSGSFNFGAQNFLDVHVSEEANRLAYDFWAKKTRARMSDAGKRDLLAPVEPVDYLFTRRAPLEQDFYESVDRENVDVVRMPGAGEGGGKGVRFTERGGIVVGDGEEREFDIVVLATGFDSYTGAISNMNIHGRDGLSINDSWKDGMQTYMGITMHGFPNCFMSYTPHAPTPLSNGPTIIESQIRLITSLIEQHSSIPSSSESPSQSASKKVPLEPTPAAQSAWREMIIASSKGTLYDRTDSWWNGANVPGKKRENMTYLGGIEEYERVCWEKVNGLHGFEGQGSRAEGGGENENGDIKRTDSGFGESRQGENANGHGDGNGQGTETGKRRSTLSSLAGVLKRRMSARN